MLRRGALVPWGPAQSIPVESVLKAGDGYRVISSGMLRRDDEGHWTLLLPAAPRTSGGRVVDARGNLVGITSWRLYSRERMPAIASRSSLASRSWTLSSLRSRTPTTIRHQRRILRVKVVREARRVRQQVSNRDRPLHVGNLRPLSCLPDEDLGVPKLRKEFGDWIVQEKVTFPRRASGMRSR